LKSIKAGRTVGNIDGNHHASSIVTFGHENENGGERGIRTPDTIPHCIFNYFQANKHI